MIQYTIQYGNDGQISCWNCECLVPVAIFDRTTENHPNGHQFHLCEICAETCLSKAQMYPSQVDDAGLYKALAYIANRILFKAPVMQAMISHLLSCTAEERVEILGELCSNFCVHCGIHTPDSTHCQCMNDD